MYIRVVQKEKCGNTNTRSHVHLNKKFLHKKEKHSNLFPILRFDVEVLERQLVIYWKWITTISPNFTDTASASSTLALRLHRAKKRCIYERITEHIFQ